MTKQKLTLPFGVIVILVVAIGFVDSTWNAGNMDTTDEISPSVSGTISTSLGTSTTTSTPNPTATATTDTSTTTNPPATSPTSTGTSTTTSTPNPTASTGSSGTSTGISSNTEYAAYTSTSSASSTNAATLQADNQVSHEDEQDYMWDSSAVVRITLNGNSISVSGGGVLVSGTTATINMAGTYSISGILTNGQIIVDSVTDGVVRLILNGVSITSATNPAIYIQNADKAIIVLSSGTENFLTDNTANHGNGTLYSKADLTICGDGTLTVKGNSNDAIRSNDGLLIKSGTLIVSAVDDAVIGKDYIIIKGVTITVNAVGDGFKSDNDEDAARGYVSIEAGILTITSTKGDGIAAETDLLITGGTFKVTSGGGSTGTLNTAISTKGLKGNANIVIDGGTFTISSSDDAVHSNGSIIINSGIFELTTKDDGIHADTCLEINGGSFSITKCYEGLESASITINNGYFEITSSDDGINAAGGNDGSSNDWFPRQREGIPGQAGIISGNYHLSITGGFIYVDAVGDGVDINGYIEMSGGVLIINGPIANMNGAIDYDSSFKLTGGTLIAVGSSGMAQAPSTTSTQYCVLLNFATAQSADKLISIQTATGQVLLTFSPTKTYQSIVYSSADLKASTYSLYLGGTCTGTLAHSIYEGGTYNGGTQYGNFTIDNTVSIYR